MNNGVCCLRKLKGMNGRTRGERKMDWPCGITYLSRYVVMKMKGEEAYMTLKKLSSKLWFSVR